MIIRDGATVSITAHLVNQHLDGSANIVWAATTPDDFNATIIARHVNAHDSLLAACRAAKKRLEFKVSDDARHYSIDDIYWLEMLERAIAKAEGKTP